MSGTAIDSFFVTFNLIADPYKKGAQDIAVANKKAAEGTDKTIKAIEKSQKSAVDTFSKMTKAAVEFFAVVAAGKSLDTLFVSSIGPTAAIGRTAEAIGTTTNRLSALHNMVQKFGGSDQDVDSVLGGITQSIQQTRMGEQSPEAALLMNTMKIPLVGANGQQRDPSDILLDAAHYLKGVDPQRAQWFGGMMGLTPAFTEHLQDTPDAKLRKEFNQGTIGDPDTKAAQDIQGALAGLDQEIVQFATHVRTGEAKNIIKFLDAFASTLKNLDDVLEGKKPVSSLITLAKKNVSAEGKWVEGKFESGWDSLFGGQTPAQGKVRDQAMAFFQSKGLTKTQAAGFVAGSIYNESNYDPKAVNPTSGASGLFQLLGPRLTDYMNTHGGKRPDQTSVQDQLDYAWKELQTTEHKSLALLKTETDARKAAIDLRKSFTRPYYKGENPGDILADQMKAAAMASQLGAPDLPDSVKTALARLVHPLRGLPGGVEADINELRRRQNDTRATSVARRFSTITGGPIHIGTIHVNAPQARNARDVASGIKQAMVEQRLVTQANGGLS